MISCTNINANPIAEDACKKCEKTDDMNIERKPFKPS